MSIIGSNILAGASGQGGSYKIARSVRTRSSNSAYFGRTPASASNRTTWTWSGWVKRGALTTSANGGVFGIFGGGTLGTSQSNFVCYFNSNYDIYLQETVNNISNQLIYETTSLYRDPSAWYHVVVAMDTTQATATNRTKIYVNGVQAPGSFSVTPGQNQALSINNNVPQYIGGASVNPQAYGNVLGYFDGYYAEVNFVDGQQLTPSAFGQFNSITGVWQPIKYAGTYGTNGYYLNFSDNSSNTATTIGKDNSGNNNNWTPNGISVTAGATYDSMLDSPTPYADGGNGRGNYSVFNPVNVSGGGTTTITNGNLATSVGSTTTFGKVLGSIGMSTGKWYWEILVTAVGGAGNIGISDGTPASGSFGLGGVAGEISYQSNGNKYTNNSSTVYGATYTTNDIIGVAYDADAGSITFYKNNTSQGAISGFSGTKYAAVGSGGGTNPQYAINFGQQPFTYTPPTGFVALNTQNLPAPTISNGANYMAASTYTGNGSTQSIVNSGNNAGAVSFKPDFVWIKNRTTAYSHLLADSVRGTTKYLVSNSTAAEITDVNSLTAFNSNGFSVGSLVDINSNGTSVVAWQWQAGAGSSSSNTSGSITSTVSVNTTAGFSIVTYTGTGVNATVGHGLGVAPKMIILKPRSIVSSWIVWQTAFAGTEYIVLESTAAKATLAAMWNSTVPTSSVFSIGTNANTNQSAATFVAYCFSEVAGYSKFGSYTGNGSTDGTFVYLGFRPRFVMTKRIDSTSQWYTIDTGRDLYNSTANILQPNSSAAESSNTGQYDELSNGFKLRTTNADNNASGGTYIYMAFAENPFKNALAR